MKAEEQLRRGLTKARRPSLFSRFTLRLARFLTGPLKRLGVDPHQFMLLLTLRLQLDDRSPRGDVTARTMGFALNFLLFTLMGVGLGIAAGAIDDSFWAMTAVQGGLFVFLSMAFAMQIGSLLFDRAEAAVVAVSPVEVRTALYARLVHGGVFIGGLAIALVLPPLLIGLSTHSLAWVPGLLLCSLLTLLTAGLGIALLMLSIARRVRPGRVRSVVVWVQMVFLGGFYAAMQIVAPLAQSMSDTFTVQRDSFLILLVPPAWFGGLHALLEGQVVGVPGLLLAAFALLVPALLGWLVARRVHGGLFEVILTDDAGPSVAGRWRKSLFARAAQPGAERQGFLFMRRMGLREHSYRLRTWPAAVYPVAAVIGMALQGGDMVDDGWVFVIGAYLAAVIAPALILHAEGAEDCDASWVFDAQPTGDPVRVVAGARKAIVVYTTLLPTLALATLALFMGGLRAAVPAFTAAGGAVCSVLALCILLPRQLPFSKPPSGGSQMDQLGWYLLAMAVAGVAAGGQLALAFLLRIELVLLPVFWAAAAFLWWRLGTLRSRKRLRVASSTGVRAMPAD